MKGVDTREWKVLTPWRDRCQHQGFVRTKKEGFVSWEDYKVCFYALTKSPVAEVAGKLRKSYNCPNFLWLRGPGRTRDEKESIEDDARRKKPGSSSGFYSHNSYKKVILENYFSKLGIPVLSRPLNVIHFHLAGYSLFINQSPALQGSTLQWVKILITKYDPVWPIWYTRNIGVFVFYGIK